MTMTTATLYLDRLDAVIFDVDGVVTDTATVHAAAWKATFDEFLRRYGSENDLEVPAFDAGIDYLRYVDGKPRLDGVRDFLAARGIVLRESGEGDTVVALAEEKTRRFIDEIGRNGVSAYPESVLLARELQRRYVPTAVVSSSRNCAQVLRAAQVERLFDVRVDGNDLDRLGLPGKPDPAPYAEAARRLGARPARCAVVEDAIAGVRAGHAGGFGVVIGVDRGGERCGEMYEAGATVVVTSLADVRLVDRTPPRRVRARRLQPCAVAVVNDRPVISSQ